MLRTLVRRPGLVDAVLAGALVLAAALEGVLAHIDRPLWLHETVIVAVMASIAWRRRFPLAVQALVVAGVLLLDPHGQTSVFAALVIASFTAGAELDPPRSWLGLAVAVLPMWVGGVVIGLPVSDYVAFAVLYGGSWAVGQTVRERGLRTAELAARAERAESERDERAARAVAEERARIARELHDIVSHSISVITLQSQAVRRRLDPEQVREKDDLQVVEATARQAMAEMRRLFGVLRADGERPPLEPQPGLDQLDRLVADNRAAGVSVVLAVAGAPVALPPGVGLAAYRIIQEALTNAREHASGGTVTVRLRYGAADVGVTVEDSGGAAGIAREAGGLGLVGMRERIALYGGSLEAGEQPDGGFTVRARLPVRERAQA